MKKIITIKENELAAIIKESVCNALLNESIKSNILKDFFKTHGGVDTKCRPFSLSDIKDEQIGYSQEFDSVNDAIDMMWKLKRPEHGMRSDFDMNYLFHVFAANDGKAILVGVDRNSIETGIYWSGEHEKRISDRLWQNGYTHGVGNYYADDSDKYYYQSPAKDFGVHHSKDYKIKKDNDERLLQMQPEDGKEKYKQDRLEHFRNYIKNNYPNTYKKIKTDS